MEFRQLRHFMAVYQQGTYAGAAQTLGITQQAVSASVAKLETALGVRLFERDKSGARPTKAAQILLPFARLIFADADRAAEALERHKSGETETMRIGVAHLPEGGGIARAIFRMQQDRPGVTLNLVSGLISELKEKLVNGELDFMIGAPPEGWTFESDLRVENLFEAQPAIACSKDHPLAGRDDLALQDLQPYPWILPPPRSPFKNIILNAFAAQGLEPPQSYIYSDSFTLGPALLDLGQHLVLTFPSLLAPLLEAGRSVILPISLDLPAAKGFVAVRKDAVLSEPVSHLLEMIREEVRRTVPSHSRGHAADNHAIIEPRPG